MLGFLNGSFFARFFEHPAGEGSELQFRKKCAQFLFIYPVYEEVIVYKSDRDIDFDGGEFFGKQSLLRKIDDILFLFSFEFVGVLQETFHRPKFFEEFGGGFFSDSRDSRNVVHGVTHQSEDISDLVHMLDVPAGADLRRPHDFYPVAHEGRFVKKNMIIHNLTKILVWGHHKDRKIFFLCFFGECSDDIICLVSI